MIIGIGTDLVDIGRIQKVLDRHGARFEQRCFTDIEQAKAVKRQDIEKIAATYAKRFAAKEACVKALGTGFIDDITMRDIGVVEDENGRPSLVLTGGALARLSKLMPKNTRPVLHLSLSDEPPYAQAFVVIEAHPL
ncbi:MAG: holo-ACP synthase [Alphaproteobacteria bacterium]|nr:MAG: holo-ACP synthase [Alphaproteobacteria bacterium]